MRLGLFRPKLPPHRAAGWGMIVLGGIVMLLAMPFTFYLALLGGLVAYLGHTLRGR